MFADQLNRLFDRARARGEPLTNEEVERRTGGRLSANHVWRLRTGRNANPGLETLELLAGVFGVSLDYFAGRDNDADEAAIRRALAQPELRSIVTRLGTSDVSARDTARLSGIIDAFLDGPEASLRGLPSEGAPEALHDASGEHPSQTQKTE